MKIRKIKNLSGLENAIENGLECGEPISFVDEQKKQHSAVFYSRLKLAEGDVIVTIEEDSTHGTRRGLYRVTKDGINYRTHARGDLDEDMKMLQNVKDTLECQKEVVEEVDELLSTNESDKLKYKQEAMAEINSLFGGKLYEGN
jgi:DNA-binding PadR family transcriptional regulator